MQDFRRASALLVTVSLIAAGVNATWNPPKPPKFLGLAGVKARIPTEVGNASKGEETTFAPDGKAARSAADRFGTSYMSANAGRIDVLLIGGTDRSALHDPRACMIGAGWELEQDHTETLPGTQVQARFCKMVGGTAETDYEVLYLYVVDKAVIQQVTQIRMQMLASALIGKKGTPVCFFRLQRSVPRNQLDNPKAAGDFRLFAAALWTQLDIPSHLIETGAPHGN